MNLIWKQISQGDYENTVAISLGHIVLIKSCTFDGNGDTIGETMIAVSRSDFTDEIIDFIEGREK